MPARLSPEVMFSPSQFCLASNLNNWYDGELEYLDKNMPQNYNEVGYMRLRQRFFNNVNRFKLEPCHFIKGEQIMVQLNINTETLPTQISNNFQPLPSAVYPALLVDVDQQPDGSVKFQIDITAGEYKGRKHFEWHSFSEDNPDLQWKVDKAYEFLGSLVNATGAGAEFAQSKDTNCLVNKPFNMDLKIYQGKNYVDKQTGETKTPNAKNIIVGIHPFTNNSPAAVATTQAAAPTAAAASGGAPWEK